MIAGNRNAVVERISVNIFIGRPAAASSCAGAEQYFSTNEPGVACVHIEPDRIAFQSKRNCPCLAVPLKAAVKTCIARRAFNDEVVKNILEYQPDAIRKSIDLSHRPELQIKTSGIRNAGEYDKKFLKDFSIERGVVYGQQYIA